MGETRIVRTITARCGQAASEGERRSSCLVATKHTPKMITKFTIAVWLVVWCLPSTSCHEIVFHINDFDVVELDLYNNMISCVALFREQFIRCNQDIKAVGSFREYH